MADLPKYSVFCHVFMISKVEVYIMFNTSGLCSCEFYLTLSTYLSQRRIRTAGLFKEASQRKGIRKAHAQWWYQQLQFPLQSSYGMTFEILRFSSLNMSIMGNELANVCKS